MVAQPVVSKDKRKFGGLFSRKDSKTNPPRGKKYSWVARPVVAQPAKTSKLTPSRASCDSLGNLIHEALQNNPQLRSVRQDEIIHLARSEFAQKDGLPLMVAYGTHDSQPASSLGRRLGTLGTLVGFASVEMVNLNVAVSEVCKSLARELNDDEVFELDIDSNSPGFKVSFDIPRSNYNLLENLKPGTTTEVLSESDAHDWLHNYVDEVEESKCELGIRIALKLDD